MEAQSGLLKRKQYFAFFSPPPQAILGVQIVITMVVASIMTKIGPFMSMARWLLISTGLVRYMHPSDDEELRQIRYLKFKFEIEIAKRLHYN